MEKRDPSVTIRKSSLFNIVSELDYLSESEAHSLVEDIFNKSIHKSARNRLYVTTKAIAKKKADRVQVIDKSDAEEFNSVYRATLMDNNIRASIIKPTDSKYIVLKEVASQAQEFCKMFDIDIPYGYKVYTRLAIDLLEHNFSVYRMKGAADNIIKRYEDHLAISNDERREETTIFYSTWKVVSHQYTGSSPQVTDPALYVHFVRGRVEADKYKADYTEWITAQFEKWAGLNSIPELSQLYGEKAYLAYVKHTGKETKYESETEKTYFKAKQLPIKRKQQVSRTKKKQL
jgi:hypothetical protein